MPSVDATGATVGERLRGGKAWLVDAAAVARAWRT